MKTAAVFGARQPFGFELCCRLLEKGYAVHGIDHQQWVTQEQEENWLFIGRNANLTYVELDDTEGGARQLISQDNCLYIIPSVDYLNRNHVSVRNQLIRLLESLTELEKKKCLLLIHPPVTERSESSFAGRLNRLFESMKKKHQVMEYCILESLCLEGNDVVPIFGSEKGQEQDTGGNPAGLEHDVLSEAVERVVSHIEQQNLLRVND